MTLLADDIRTKALHTPLPWGGDGNTISLHSVYSLASAHGVSGRIVEIEALKQDVFPRRYLRNMQTITPIHQIRLLESSVAQVGLGGLGGILLDTFLRTGIGTIRGADGDHFEESNLNRQALCTPTNLTQPKGCAAVDRGNEINPSVNLTTCNEFLTPETLPDFLAGSDVAVDALGGLEMRLHLQQAAAHANIPLVTGGLAGWTGYVGVVQPGETGPASIMGQDNGVEEKLGCPAPAVNLIASLMAMEVIKLLTTGQTALSQSMLIVDLQSLTFETVSIS